MANDFKLFTCLAIVNRFLVSKVNGLKLRSWPAFDAILQLCIWLKFLVLLPTPVLPVHYTPPVLYCMLFPWLEMELTFTICSVKLLKT